MHCLWTRWWRFTKRAKKGKERLTKFCMKSMQKLHERDQVRDMLTGCFFHQDLGQHGQQHHPELLQRGHLHLGHRKLSQLLASHSVRDLTGRRGIGLQRPPQTPNNQASSGGSHISLGEFHCFLGRILQLRSDIMYVGRSNCSGKLRMKWKVGSI